MSDKTPDKLPSAGQFITTEASFNQWLLSLEYSESKHLEGMLIEFAKMHVERLLRMDDYYLEEDIQEKISNIK